MSKKIIFKIKGDGELSVEGAGFKGESCLEKSEKYMRGLGKVEKQDKKDSYYETPEEIDIVNYQG